MKIARQVLALLYALFIIYYTVLTRSIGTERIFKPLFWELNIGAWLDITMNMLLFLPLGFLIGKKTGIAIGFALSVGIEVVQYIFKLGFCEPDDVLNNTIGAVIGWLIAQVAHKLWLKIK